MLLVLVGVVLGTLILLAMPFDVGFRLKKDDRFHLRLSIAWAYGLLTKELGKTTQKPKKKPEPKKRTGKENFRAAIAFIRSPGMSARLSRLAQNMWRQCHVRQLYLHLTFGLDDPADTGQLYGALAPALMLTDRLHRFDLQVQPDFSQPTLVAESRGEIRVIPLTIISTLIVFLLSPTSWRGFVAAARANKYGVVLNRQGDHEHSNWQR